MLVNRAFWSLSAAHVCVKLGADWLSHIVRPSQKVARSWKSNVPPMPAWFGLVGGFLGSVIVYVRSFPVPGRWADQARWWSPTAAPAPAGRAGSSPHRPGTGRTGRVQQRPGHPHAAAGTGGH